MKNTLKFYTITVLLVLLAVSCKKKSSEEDIASLPYANETVDQGKANLTTTGQQMVSELSDLADVQGISGAQSMSHFLDIATPFTINTQSANVFAAIEATNEAGAKKDVKGIMRFLSTNIVSKPDTTIKQVFENNKGIYTWNKTTQKWVKTAATDKIELLFPSTEAGQTNNAKLDITYTGIAASSSLIGLNGDLPGTFDAVLYTNNTKVLEYYFNAQYDNTGIPTHVNTFLALYPFKFETTMDKSSSNASVRYLFTDDVTTILDFYFAVNGNLDQTSLENSSSVTDVASNANAYFQVLNIKLAGRIDASGLSQKMTDINNDKTLNTNKARVDAQVVAYNQFIALVCMYADTKQKIAQAEFYNKPTLDNYGTSYSADMKFVFKDGSKDDLAAYFGTGFSAVVDDFNTLIVKLNNDYDMGLNQVSY